MKEVFVVFKNVDFTEGKGPMTLHSIWTTWEEANKFVMAQGGIMGTPQQLYNEFFTNPSHCYWSYNGYGIQKTPIFEKYTKEEFDQFGKKL